VSFKKVTEEVMLRLVARDHSMENLCLAGGVALNCIQRKVSREGAFKRNRCSRPPPECSARGRHQYFVQADLRKELHIFRPS
jgi:hypothetical protein